MVLMMLSLGGFLLAAAGAMATRTNPRICSSVSGFFAVVAGGLGLPPCLSILAGGPKMQWSIPWEIPFGNLSFCLDALSAFFLVPVFGLGILTAVYGVSYFPHSIGKKNLGWGWACFFVLWISICVVLLAANGLLFLLAWELTVLSSFFLILLAGNHEKSRQAGWIYLTASHLGTGFLLVLFLLLARESGSFEWTAMAGVKHLPGGLKSLMFLLALIGFGTKAGFMPFHIWLPEAHPAAPGNVSALMSGVMIKTGIYGLVRTLFILGHPAPWWGWALLLIGLVSGILGVLFALAQHDLKRLLAYHSVENIGIIALGIGLGIIGLSRNNAAVAILGLSGGILHVLNHAIFKGLLFLGAGAVIEQTGSGEIDRQGGLLKAMPWTGNSFLVGCLAISGLPPFNGFISEFFIYFAAFLAVLSGNWSLLIPGLLIILGLPLIGGLAAACFAKAFSVVFLGSPRSLKASEAKEAGWFMVVPMTILAALCAMIGLASPLLPGILKTVIEGHPDLAAGVDLSGIYAQIMGPLLMITRLSLGLFLLLGLVSAIRRQFLTNQPIGESLTWDCGFAQPTTTMQYTGSSFAQPLTELFHPFLQTESHLTGVDGYFPQRGSFSSHTSDLFQKALFEPLFRRTAGILHRLLWLQNGIVQIYVLYIAITLIVLLVGGLL
jgi:formate hydrogenlyase subunit 3/multisubunit Na+/H+ antiporter MnhD subunit